MHVIPREDTDGWMDGWVLALTNVGEDGGHRVSSSLVAGQAAVDSFILFLHVSYNQRAIWSHPVPEDTRQTIPRCDGSLL